MMRNTVNHFIVLTLAAAALVFAAGCDFKFDLWATAVGYDPNKESDDWYTLRCDPTSKVYTLDSTSYPRRGAVDSAFSLLGMLGKPCTPSPPKGRPGSMSDPVNSPSNNNITDPNNIGVRSHAPSAAAPATTAPPAPPSLLNTFPWLMPLAFPPTFPDSDAGKNPLSCPPSLGVFLVNHLQNTVSTIGLCPFRVVKEISVRSSPLDVAITPDATTALVTSYDGAVTFIDVATNTILGALDLVNYNPHGLAISPDSTRAYVTHYLDQGPALLVIDIPNRKLLSTIKLPKAYPREVILTPDGSQAWVNYLSDRVVSIVDLLTGTVASTVDLGSGADTGMAFDPTGTKAYVAIYPDQVAVVDTATLGIVAKITVATSPMDLVVAPEGNRLFVSTESDAFVYAVDLNTNKVIQRYVTPAGTPPGTTMGLKVFH